MFACLQAVLSGRFQQSRVDRSSSKDTAAEVDHKTEKREERRKRAAGGKMGGGAQVPVNLYQWCFHISSSICIKFPIASVFPTNQQYQNWFENLFKPMKKENCITLYWFKVMSMC